MENQKKVRKHRLVESHPVLASILACIRIPDGTTIYKAKRQ